MASIAERGVNLLAFCAVPMGPEHTQLMLFPDDAGGLQEAVRSVNTQLLGPHRAFLVQGDDRLGAIADIYSKLAKRGVEVYSSSGVTDGRGGFGYVLYVRPEQHARAAEALGVAP